MSSARVGFVAEPDGRGTTALLWSCLFTWLLCLWNLFHSNIPAHNESKITYTGRKVFYTFFGAIAPEWIAAIAMTQWRDASVLLREARSLNTIAYLPHPNPANHELSRTLMGKEAIQHLRETHLNQWTLRHGFYCIMGGFTISVPEDPSHPFPVNSKQLLWLIQKGLVRIPSITEEEINDKSKADSLAKLLAFGQTIWFVAQCIGRGLQHLPTSTLEVTTLAYIACMIPSFLFWWRKPYDIETPTALEIVHWPPGTSEQLDMLSPEIGWVLYQRINLIRYPRMINSITIDIHWITRDIYKNPNWILPVITSLLFGAIHCIAWNFEFPTEIERWLWRGSGAFIIFMSIVGIPLYWWRNHPTSVQESIVDRKRIFIDFTIVLGNWIYIALRLYLLVEVFIEFRAMPEGVYKTVDWTLYIPNI